jgi:hypothetical protein
VLQDGNTGCLCDALAGDQVSAAALRLERNACCSDE